MSQLHLYVNSIGLSLGHVERIMVQGFATDPHAAAVAKRFELDASDAVESTTNPRDGERDVFRDRGRRLQGGNGTDGHQNSHLQHGAFLRECSAPGVRLNRNT